MDAGNEHGLETGREFTLHRGSRLGFEERDFVMISIISACLEDAAGGLGEFLVLLGVPRPSRAPFLGVS